MIICTDFFYPTLIYESFKDIDNILTDFLSELANTNTKFDKVIYEVIKTMIQDRTGELYSMFYTYNKK